MKNKKVFNPFSYLKKYRVFAILAPVFKCVETATELFVPFIMAKIIDIGIKNQDLNYVIRLGVIIVVLNLVGFTFAIFSHKFAAIASVGAAKDIRHSIFEKINTYSHSELDKFSTTTLLNRCVNDVRNIQDGLGHILRILMRTPFLLIGSLILTLFIDIKLSVIFVVILPLLVLVIWKFMKKIKPILLRIKSKLDRTTAVTRENLTGVRVVRAFNKQNYEAEKFKDANYDLINSQIEHGAWNSALSPVISLIVNLSIIALLYFGGFEVNIGGISQGNLIAFIDYFGTVSSCVLNLATTITILNRMSASTERVNDLFLVENSIKSPARATEIGEISSIEFKDVNFSYSNVKNTVSNLSFSASPGEIIGIIGGTGSGKSSIVNLIPRFYDVSSGEILINDKNIKSYSVEDLRENIGLVPQNPTLFAGTIRSNMCWRKEDATDEEIIKALRIAQAFDFVKEYPDFLDHKVNRGGTNFSGGQRQRLTIARALVGNPQIVILDDASSALDFATDAKLRRAIRTNLEKSIIFIVTQRTNSIKDANKIIVVNNGEIVGIGTHDELLESCEVYSEIHYSQNKREVK